MADSGKLGGGRGSKIAQTQSFWSFVRGPRVWGHGEHFWRIFLGGSFFFAFFFAYLYDLRDFDEVQNLVGTSLSS